MKFRGTEMASQTDSRIGAENACMVYVTVGAHAEATMLARTAVGERLAACANILGPATSIYRWKGEVEEAQEFVLIFKTRRTLSGQLAARIKALHSYATPCIVTYAMTAADPAFLGWLAAETVDPESAS